MNLDIFLDIVFIILALRTIRADVNRAKYVGPLAFYNVIGCKPINKTIVNGCATEYNCDHVKSLTWNKCYVNCKAYDVGEKLREEDANPCDIDCTCSASATRGVSQFICAVVKCSQDAPKPGCYFKKSPLECCPGEEVCPENPEDRATCVVDGTTYKDGEYFSVESEPDLNCVCQPGYEGKNIEPFCAKPKRPYCNPLFGDPVVIRDNCAPVYYSSQSPQTDCAVNYRCQNNKDKVIVAEDTEKAGRKLEFNSSTKNSRNKFVKKLSDDVCYFGSLVMRRGEELNQYTDYSSVCVKCVCEVGPTPTCQRLPDEECDVTKKSFAES